MGVSVLYICHLRVCVCHCHLVTVLCRFVFHPVFDLPPGGRVCVCVCVCVCVFSLTWTKMFVAVCVGEAVQGRKCCNAECVWVCVSISGGGKQKEARGLFTRSASCRVERLEGDNNSQVKIQLFAWGLTLWGLSGRSAGGEGFQAPETEATYKALLLLLSPPDRKDYRSRRCRTELQVRLKICGRVKFKIFFFFKIL